MKQNSKLLKRYDQNLVGEKHNNYDSILIDGLTDWIGASTCDLSKLCN